MYDALGLVVAAGIGAASWIYHKAWDRQQARILRYEEIVKRLQAFTQGQHDPDQIDEVLIELHRLYLFAPDDVVLAANAFLEAAAKGETKRPALGKLFLAMRNDASFRSILVPRFRNSQLSESDLSLLWMAHPRS
jgi:hypothetical protein